MENNTLTINHRVGSSMCDFRYRLGIAQTVDLFMDAAEEHSDRLGVGLSTISKMGYFWMAARTKLCFHGFPGALDDISVTTWPARIRCGICNRYYTLTRNGELMTEGRTEWAIFNRNIGRIDTNPDEIFSKVPYSDEIVCGGRMARINRDFSGVETLGTYTVSSADIDVGRHMNNVKYIRAMLSMFSTEQQERMDIRGLEINYLSQSMEGETLSIMKRDAEGGMELGVLHADDRAAATAKLLIAE